MAIPLPRVVADVGPGGGLATSLEGLNALRQSNAIAKYAPYNAYADAMSKLAYAQYAPYQIQAQVMSNPLMALAFKDHPEQFAAMMKDFTKSVPSQNGLANNLGIPVPGQTGNGLLGMLLGKITGQGGNALAQGMPEQGASTNPLSAPAGTPAASTNALNPGLGGTAAGAIGATTAPLVKSPFIPSPTVPNQQGGLTQAPTAETITSGQKAITAAKRVDPILKNIMRDFQDVYNVPGFIKTAGSALGNLSGASPETLKKFGISKDAYSKYLKAESNVKKGIIDVMKVYDIHQEEGMNDRIADILRFHPGEDKEGYFDRVKSEIDDLKTQQSINEKAITSGFEVNPEGQPEAVAVSAPTVTQRKKPRSPSQKVEGGEMGSLPAHAVSALQSTATDSGMSVPMVISELSKTEKGRKWLKENGVQ